MKASEKNRHKYRHKYRDPMLSELFHGPTQGRTEQTFPFRRSFIPEWVHGEHWALSCSIDIDWSLGTAVRTADGSPPLRQDATSFRATKSEEAYLGEVSYAYDWNVLMLEKCWLVFRYWMNSRITPGSKMTVTFRRPRTVTLSPTWPPPLYI